MDSWKLSFLVVVVEIDSTPHRSVDESDGYVEICVEANHEAQTAYEVILTTTDDTATGA